MLLYDPRLPKYRLTAAKLEQELNKADKLTFFIYPNHPNSSRFHRLKSTIVVSEDSEIKSRCRILDDDIGWENGRNIVCEGELAFFHDSIQRPFSFPVDQDHATPADLFEFLISRHNEQVSEDRRFEIGNCTVTDPNNYINRSDSEYSTTWELLNEQLLNTLGGYLWVRHENGRNIIDYLADFNVLANQPIRAGVNLLSIKTTRRGAEIATAILPLGRSDTESDEPLTISSLPDSETDDICKEGDLVYSKSAELQFGGRIIAVEKWDDVTIPSNLLSKATARLLEKRQLPSQVVLTAADLSAAGYDFATFSLGTYVDIVDDWHSEAHGLLARYLVKKLNIDLLNPSKNTLTLGSTTYSMTENNQRAISAAMQTVETNVRQETAKTVREVEQRNQSAIEQSEERITLTVSESYYTKGETDDLVGAVQTSIEQTADGIRIDFSNLQKDVDDVAAKADAEFASLQSYIQMAGGAITLGEIGNEVTLKVENDRIGIYVNGVAMTYWTASDFVAPITLTIPVGGRLILGNYAFIPRTNGSLDLTWVGE